jgi:CBS-domain-containing membrane protein
MTGRRDRSSTRATVGRSVRHSARVRFLTRALAVLLVVVAYTFLLNLPHPPSAALGVGYGVSAVCSACAAWLLWCQADRP